MNPEKHIYTFEMAAESARFLKSSIAGKPLMAVMAGTGLGEMRHSFEIEAELAYDDIPHFPATTVQSHAGRFIFGRLNGKPVVLLEGRFHLYEGYSPQAVTFPIRVLQALGIGTLVLTNASGGLNTEFAAGDIMVVVDHINLTGANPLIGTNEERWGVRFPDMTAAYPLELRNCVLACAQELGITVRQGSYAGLKGPSLETPAEMRYLRTIGADAVGFSTVMETIAAVHSGIRVLGLSTITNMCVPDQPAPADVDAIIAVARAAAPRLGALIGAVLEQLEDPTNATETR